VEFFKESRVKTLSVPEQHRKKIAINTLKMSDAGARIMGGMTKEEARNFLKEIGYSDNQIRKLEARQVNNRAVIASELLKVARELLV
jgi:hypothetical protein